MLRHFGINGLERVDMMIVKGAPTHHLIWEYLTRKINSSDFISGLTELDRKLDQDPTEWVLPSQKELLGYRKQILNDKGLGHSLLELSNLIFNQKYIWPFVVEVESTINDKNKMHNALGEYQSLLSKKRLRQISKGPSKTCRRQQLVDRLLSPTKLNYIKSETCHLRRLFSDTINQPNTRFVFI